MNYIQNIIEPNRLFLAWQPRREIDETRTRRAIGELFKRDGNVVFRYMVEADDYRKAIEFGLEPYIPFVDQTREYVSSVVDIFSQRLPPRSRRDFSLYLESLCIRHGQEISDFSLLGYSGAVLPSDSFSIVNTFEGINTNCQFLLEIAGFRYYSDQLGNIGIGTKVEILAEPDNIYDSYAIKLAVNGQKIGNINRLMLPAFHRWLSAKNIDIVVERIEGNIDRVRVFVFVSVS